MGAVAGGAAAALAGGADGVLGAPEAGAGTAAALASAAGAWPGI
jgi:hypothetical protein